jgi:hypothetical protein
MPSDRHPIERPPRPLCPLTRIMILRDTTPFRKNRERETAAGNHPGGYNQTCFIETRKFAFRTVPHVPRFWRRPPAL